MRGHIKAVQMVDIQSWSRDLPFVLEFETDKLNVIRGRNETGKSVMFKVFRQMCFSNFLGRNGRRSLIRRGAPYGQLVIITNSGYRVMFRMFPTSQDYTLTSLTDPDDSQYWKQNTLPEPIREELGWYIDEESNILLNLIDTEMALPMVNSTPKFNADVLRFITEDPDLNNVLETLTDWHKDLTVMRERYAWKINKLEGMNDAIEFKDVDVIRGTLTDGLEVERKLKVLSKVRGVVSAANLAIDKPHLPSIDFNVDEVVKGYYGKLETLDTMTSLFNRLLQIDKPSFQEVDVEELISNVKVIRDVAYQMAVLYNSIGNRDKAEESLTDKTSQLRELEKEIGVCPLCEQKFREDKEV